MNRIRSFVPLGSPQNATKLIGSLSEFSISPFAQIMAANKTKSELIISPGAHKQAITITSQPSPDNKVWLFQKEIVLAHEGNQTVVAAPGGLYRVDIGYGSRFICDPAKVVGTLGLLNAQVVFAESRFDVAKAWGQHIWRSSSMLFSEVYNKSSSVLSRIPIPETFHRYVSKIQGAHYTIPPNIKQALWQSRKKSSEAFRWTANKLFKVTHPAKLKIEGPTSILIKP